MRTKNKSENTAKNTAKPAEKTIANAANATENPPRKITDPSLLPSELGKKGEDYACRSLCESGWKILDRNDKTRCGEQDIIALDDDGTIVFVEVKTRRSTNQGIPQEAVTERKAIKLRKTAAQWLRENNSQLYRPVRFDVFALEVKANSEKPEITHIKGAF